MLLEVGWLCEWWGLVKPRHRLTSFRRARRSGFRTQWNNLPDCFQIGVPKTKKKFCENHALEIAEIENIWNYVTSEARPSQPTILAKHPTGPKRGWLLSRASAWRTAQQSYKRRLAWFHRQQMLWAMLFGSAMRLSEVPLLQLADVQFYGEDLSVSLRMRKTTEGFGRAKTGPDRSS